MPTGVFIAFIILLVVAWLVLLVSISQIGGQPTMSGSHNYLNDHGDFIPVTRGVYCHALVLRQPIFTLVPAVFFALGVLRTRRGAGHRRVLTAYRADRFPARSL